MAAEREPKPPTAARFTVGDSLRAIAALGVFALHALGEAVTDSGYVDRLGADPTKRYASLFGFVGNAFNGLEACVALFFVLSGYLLSRPFLAAFIADAPTPSIVRYLRNRALRILPALWVVLLLVLVLFGTHGDSPLQFLGLATFLRSYKESGLHDVFGQGWSLNVEVRFYLFLPLAAFALIGLKRLLGARFPRRARIVFVLVLIAIGFTASQNYAPHDGPNYDSFAANACFFAPGLILATLEHLVPFPPSRPRWVLLVAPLLFVAGSLLMLFSYYLAFRITPSMVRYVTPIGTGLIVGAPLLWQWCGRPAWRLLDNRPLQWAGARSYPIFLVHTLVIAKLGPHLVVGGYKTTLLLLVVVTLPITLLVSDLIHRYVELPALKFRGGGPRRPPEAPPVAPEATGELAGMGASAAP